MVLSGLMMRYLINPFLWWSRKGGALQNFFMCVVLLLLLMLFLIGIGKLNFFISCYRKSKQFVSMMICDLS